MLQCGLAELEITPPLGSSIPGHTVERKSTGIKNPLYAKALVIESGQVVLAFVVIDALYLPLREANRIRQRLFDYTGIPPEQVMVFATHSHTGPPVRTGLDGSMHEEYLAILADRAADAAIIAYTKRKAAVVGWGSGELSTISFNRRYWMKNGELRTNPGYLNPDIDRPAGPIDPAVSVIRIDDMEGNPLGVVTNFTCHTDTVGGTEYSADYPAELSRVLKQALGEQAVSLFILGACGDINHVDVNNPRPVGENITHKMGRLLAEEVQRVHGKITCQASIDLIAGHSHVAMKLREATEAEVAEARHVLSNDKVTGANRFFAEQVMKVHDLPSGVVQLEVQAFRLGNLAFVGLPGEIFVELGLAVKEKSPYPGTIVGTLCNGSIYGYVCTEEAYQQGGYEPRLKAFNRITPGTGERLAHAAAELLIHLR